MAAGGDVLMLGVSGMRGIAGSTLTVETVARFAGALGAWLGEHRRAVKSRDAITGKTRSVPLVVLGRDGRAGGDVYHAAARAGLQQAGCDVVDAGVAMTPSIGLAVDSLGASGGLVLTASHNPQQWNGCKPMVRDADARGRRPSASAPDKRIADEIISIYKGGSIAPKPFDKLGRVVRSLDAGAAHAERVVELARGLGVISTLRKRRPLAVIDSVGGAGTAAGPELLSRLGCRPHAMYERVGVFPHVPEPTAQNLTGLCRAVKKHGAAMGFAQDPDADRLAIVDERGRYIGEEYTLVLACRALLEFGGLRRGGSVAVNLSTSRMIDDLCASHKVRVLRTPVGEANVVEAMKRERCAFGGEGNGGVIWPSVTYIRDSLGAMALVLALVARTGRTLSQLVGEMPAYAIEKRKVDLARKEDARPAVEKIAAAYKGERVDLQDGVRVDFASRSAWVHVRASNTEPIMRLIAEAPDGEQARGLVDEVAGVIAR